MTTARRNTAVRRLKGQPDRWRRQADTSRQAEDRRRLVNVSRFRGEWPDLPSTHNPISETKLGLDLHHFMIAVVSRESLIRHLAEAHGVTGLPDDPSSESKLARARAHLEAHGCVVVDETQGRFVYPRPRPAAAVLEAAS